MKLSYSFPMSIFIIFSELNLILTFFTLDKPEIEAFQNLEHPFFPEKHFKCTNPKEKHNHTNNQYNISKATIIPSATSYIIDTSNIHSHKNSNK